MSYGSKRKLSILALATFLLFSGGVLSVAKLLEGSTEIRPSITLNSAPAIEICQVSADIKTPCSKGDAHSDAAGGSEHCQTHCGHSNIVMLTKSNPISPNDTSSKIADLVLNTPESVTLDPQFRPPNH